MDCISGWNKRKPLLKEGQRLINEYERIQSSRFKSIEHITRPGIRRTFMYGNHEERVNWYIEEHPRS